MAKVEYVVVDGCVQDGAKVVKKGEVFVPSSAEIRDLLLEEGCIAARGKLESGGSRTARRPLPAPLGAPAPATGPAPAAGDGGNPAEEEEEEDEDDDTSAGD